jgi:hypothetical protein
MVKFVVIFLSVIAGIVLQAGLPAAASSRLQIQPASAKGIILDWNGKKIRGATIIIENSEIKRQLKSDRVGEFAIDLPPGFYAVSVEHYSSKLTLPYVEVKPGLILTISFPFPPSHILRTDPQSLNLNGKVRGTIINWACDALPEAKITFRNKKQAQVVTPDHNGYFLVDLPSGDYQAIVQLSPHGAHKITSRKLIAYHDKEGDLCLWVDTGMRADHGSCFAQDIDYQLIPVQPIRMIDFIEEKKSPPQP